MDRYIIIIKMSEKKTSTIPCYVSLRKISSKVSILEILYLINLLQFFLHIFFIKWQIDFF